MYTALSINNPVWTTENTTGLWNVLKNFWGKGPTACVIFANGDSACFQVNPLAPGASRVIAKSAKDINGNPISTDGDSPIGNGDNTGVVVDNKPGVVNYSPFEFARPIIACVRVGNNAMHCTAQLH
jgi:hypothetical protein